MTKAHQPFITLTRIKQWYIPADTESYLALKQLKIPLARIEQNFLPTVGVLLKRNGFRAKSVDFRTKILEPQLDKWGALWLKRDHRSVSMSTKNLRFETTKAEAHAMAAKAIPNLEEAIMRFFKRWGFSYKIDYSVARGKIRFNVDYYFDQDKLPLITLSEDEATLPKVDLQLGFTKLGFTFGTKYIETVVEVSQGGVFTPIHTTKCLYSELSDVRPLLAAFMDSVNKDKIEVRPVLIPIPEKPSDPWPMMLSLLTGELKAPNPTSTTTVVTMEAIATAKKGTCDSAVPVSDVALKEKADHPVPKSGGVLPKSTSVARKSVSPVRTNHSNVKKPTTNKDTVSSVAAKVAQKIVASRTEPKEK